MANFMTAPANFTKQSVEEFFVQPFFQGEDLRQIITVRTDIKGTEVLNTVTRPSKITKRKLNPGFVPSGSIALSHKDITVKPLAIEYEQNAREFMNSVLQIALAKGYLEDDVNNMANPAFWNSIVLPIIAEAGKEDLIRQIFFADETKENLSAGIIDNTVDTDYQVYSGLWTNFLADLKAAIIPAEQKIAIDCSAVKQELVETLSGMTAGTITLKVNNKDYSQAWNTDINTTITDWITSHATELAGRGIYTGIDVTSGGDGAIKFVASHAGQGFEVTVVDAGTNGTFTPSGVVANAQASALGTDQADTTMEAMLDAMPPEMNQFNPSFLITNSMLRNLIKTLKNTGTEQAHTAIINGVSTLMYEGYPIYVRPDWDKNIRADHNSVYPHRALLAPMENLLFGTDGASDDESVETWYNQDSQMRRYRVQYKAQTTYLAKELLVLAY